MAVQFKDVATGSIKIKDLVKVSTPKGGGTIGGTVDQIWTYDGNTWTKYFYYDARGVKKWLKTPVTTPATALETEDTINNGQSFFFVRSSSGAVGDTVTLAGEVVALADKPEYPVTAGSTTAMAYLWPMAFKIKNFNQFNANPKGGGTIGGTVDQIWTYDGNTWTKYFYYDARGVKKWLKTPVSTPATALETEDEIAVGQAFFFVRSSSGAAGDKITFKQL